jgi:hypothetical protein
MDKATGGFPPIIKCEKQDIKILEQNKNRQFESVKNTISIKDIMEKRKNITPFI